MKVILTVDVPEVGSRGDHLDVSAGYARNFLLPRRFAVPATSGNLATMAEENRLSGRRQEKARQEARKVASFLGDHEIFTTLKIGAEGKAFGSVTAKELAVLLRQAGLEVDRRRIRLDVPIRRLGVFDIPIHIHSEVDTVAKLFVDRESGSKDGARAAQAQWDAAEAARLEAERVEAEARAEREREAEEAARQAIERAEARRKREQEEAEAREAAKTAAAASDAEGSDGSSD